MLLEPRLDLRARGDEQLRDGDEIAPGLGVVRRPVHRPGERCLEQVAGARRRIGTLREQLLDELR